MYREAELVRELGGEVAIAGDPKDHATTDIIQKFERRCFDSSGLHCQSSVHRRRVVLLSALRRPGPGQFGRRNRVCLAAASPWMASLFPGVTRSIKFDKRGVDRGLSGVHRLREQILDFSPDVFLTPHRGWRMGYLAHRLRPKVRTVGFQGFWGFCFHDKVQFKAGDSFFAREARLLDALGVPHTAAKMRCGDQAERRTPRLFWRPAPTGPPNDGRQRPLQSWQRSCKQSGRPVALTGGPMEAAVCAEIAAKVPGTVNRCGESLVEALRHMKKAALVIANDSGLAHLARAAGCPTLILFGPTPSTVHELEHEPHCEAVALPDLGCAPCSAHGHQVCPKNHHRCMNDLPVSQVRERADGLL